ncbi:uncharacterized protein LOC127852360 isoform X3 [Dreissena polymorpha]|uniref:uncharacterized protein LOC127852360 isoform X3 n=1 Tax=Dreissena polymorpha TaxID=45954 RepID=UPI002263B8A8|nr:uncharacterized protein LOC127852360 isoform X3 [Dreissena polymorpha]
MQYDQKQISIELNLKRRTNYGINGSQNISKFIFSGQSMNDREENQTDALAYVNKIKCMCYKSPPRLPEIPLLLSQYLPVNELKGLSKEAFLVLEECLLSNLFSYNSFEDIKVIRNLAKEYRSIKDYAVNASGITKEYQEWFDQLPVFDQMLTMKYKENLQLIKSQSVRANMKGTFQQLASHDCLRIVNSEDEGLEEERKKDSYSKFVRANMKATFRQYASHEPLELVSFEDHEVEEERKRDSYRKFEAEIKTVTETKESKRRFKLLRKVFFMFHNCYSQNKRRPKLLEGLFMLSICYSQNKRMLKLLKDMHGRRGALLKGADKITVTEIKEVHKKAHMDFKGLLTDAEDDFAIEALRKPVENVIMKYKRRLKLLEAKYDRRGVLLKGADKKTVTEIKGTMQYYHRIESREYTETTTNDKECRTQLNAYVKITLEMLNIALEIVSSKLILHRNIFPEVIRMFLHFPTMEEDDSKEQKLQ